LIWVRKELITIIKKIDYFSLGWGSSVTNMRKIVIKRITWEYRIGKSYAVIKKEINDPEPKENEMITPKDIKNYIEKNL